MARKEIRLPTSTQIEVESLLLENGLDQICSVKNLFNDQDDKQLTMVQMLGFDWHVSSSRSRAHPIFHDDEQRRVYKLLHGEPGSYSLEVFNSRILQVKETLFELVDIVDEQALIGPFKRFAEISKLHNIML